MALSLFLKVLLMFFLVSIGFLMFRKNLISQEGSKTIGNILIYVSLPCMIIRGFIVERTPGHLLGLFVSTVAAFLVLLMSMLLSGHVFKGDGIASFAGAFSNPGFFGIPLMVAAIGKGGVFYAAAFISFLNILQWTWGVQTLTGSSGKIKLRDVLRAPFMKAVIIGLLLFFLQPKLPEMAYTILDDLAGINTPLAMFVTGVYLAQSDIPAMLKRKKLYAVAGVRLLLIPAVTLLILLPIPSGFIPLKLAILIASSCPVGSNVAVYAQLHGKDYGYAVETVIVSTLFSILTVPTMVTLGNYCFQLFGRYFY